MSAPTSSRRLLLLVLTAAACVPFGLPLAASNPGSSVPSAADAGNRPPDGAVHRLRLTRQRPPCARPADLPVVPNDPGTRVGTGGTRCLGTRPPELELWLPEDRYLWLQPSAANPAAWIDLGLVWVDAASLEPAPLGLRITAGDSGWTLETRHDHTATLTPLEPGAWREVTSPDGRRFWVQLDGSGSDPRPLGRGSGRVTYRAD